MSETQQSTGWAGAERRRVEAVVETLATTSGGSETLLDLAHDTRNMVTALGLYCDLLEEPGVLAAPYRHYGSELRLVAAASRRLVEKLVALDTQDRFGREVQERRGGSDRWPVTGVALKRGRISERTDRIPPATIANFAAELLANRNLLSALAGPKIQITLDAEGGAFPVQLTGEDLTRILVNLIKNAAEAMPAGGAIELTLRVLPPQTTIPGFLSLTVQDNGPGIPESAIGQIFDAGFSTRTGARSDPSWPTAHRGLGLSITRSILDAVGGRIEASNPKEGGARFVLELPHWPC